jgi:hypothetical protein
MPLKNWSTTAGSNTSAAPNGAPEGMTIASVNDTIRQVMADVRTLAAADTIAAASTTDIGTKDATWLTLTGAAVTITSLGTVSAGIYKHVIYNAAHTLTHNATSLILIGGASRTVASGDVSLFISEGSGNWRELIYTDVSSLPASLASNTFNGLQTLSGVSLIDANASIAAHATTMNPWSLGNYVTATGTAVTFTGMANAPQAGAEVEIYMNAAHVFTDGAVFEVDGDANYTATIGDRVLIRAKSTTVFTVHPRKKDGTAVVPPTAATQSQQETATSLLVPVTPGRQHFHPSAAKAWAKATFAGAVIAGYNVTSVTDNGIGDMSFDFTVPFSTDDYVAIGIIESGGAAYTASVQGQSTTSCRMQCRDQAGNLIDATSMMFIAFGDQ